MKALAPLLISLMAIFSQSVFSDVIYKEGSYSANLLADFYGYLPDDAYVVFVADDNRSLFFNDIDYEKIKKDKALLEFISESRSSDYILGERTFAYSLNRSLQEGRHKKSFCKIFFKSERFIAHAYMHEVIHCITNSARERSNVASAVNSFIKSDKGTNYGLDASDMIKSIILHEAHTHIFADIFMRKTGNMSDMAAQKNRAKQDYPNSVGKESTLYGISFCKKYSCSLVPSELMRQLLNSREFIHSLREDIRVAVNHSVKVEGYLE